jgi:aminoglycoside phosphotransferase family enzyme/predicted kinase
VGGPARRAEKEVIVVTDGQPDDLVRSLSRPAAYPWQPSAVELVETHISWVFLAGDRVVKVKRPVRFGFVDHATLARRRHSCEEEVRLNRRLTDGVYLGVVPITRNGDGFRLDGHGLPVEWATLMRRLPADRMLDALLAAGAAPTDLAGRLAGRLVPFHLGTASACGAEPYGATDALARVVTDNLDELRPFAGTILGSVQLGLVDGAMRAFLGDQTALLARRVADGWVRDGHGDLIAEHVCLEEDGTVQVYDCVEFSPAIRCADVASDLAYLLMDLDRLGADEAAVALEARYRAAGIDLPTPLVRLYRAHRALVRAKVDCLTVATGHEPHPTLPAEAGTYLNLAARAALTVRPFLIAMTGLSGTGKSTVARQLAQATGAALFSSDVVRKELAAAAGPAPAAWGEGIYTEAWTARTYDRLLALAAEALAASRPAILDATFLDTERRAAAAAVAAAVGAPFLLVETICDEATVAARLAARQARGDSPSDATLAVYRAQRAAFAASPPALPGGAVAVRVDTAPSVPAPLEPVVGALRDMRCLIPRLPANE